MLKVFSDTAQIGMSENVDCAALAGRTDIVAVFVPQPFADCNDNGMFLFLQHADAVKKSIFVKRNFRYCDNIRLAAAHKPRQPGSQCQPAGIPAHDLDDCHRRKRIDCGIPDQLLHGNRQIACGTAIAGRMITAGQVVVNCFREAEYGRNLLFRMLAAHLFKISGQLADGIHAVVAADIQKPSDIPFIQTLQDFFVNRVVLVSRKLEAAGPQRHRGGSSQLFQIGEAGQVNGVVLENTFNAVEGTENPFHFFRFRSGMDDTGQCGVDCTAGAAGLADQKCFGSDSCHRKVPSFLEFKAGLQINCKF